MRLSSLEIIGFKSFATRVVLEFGSGIMAVVGPNGCGKTNVVDAIRWVLGEQALKSLRVNSARDLIFKGTKSRRPFGFAEVSITLVGDELPSHYRGSAKISRRITGDNEIYYLINDIPVRLKDVHNLLYDTGIGVGSYYHIDQETIKRILDSNPAERRALFEEAAGVSKFKRDLHEARLKLSSTSTKLETLQLVINERTERVDALRREASKASRFLTMKKDLSEIGKKLFSSKLARTKISCESFQQRVNLLREKGEKLAAELANLELARDKLILEKNHRESLLKDVAFKIKEVEAKRNRLSVEIATLKEKGLSLEKAIENARVVLSELEQGCSRFDEERKALEEKLRQAREIVEKFSNDIRNLSVSSAEVGKNLLALKNESRKHIAVLDKLNSQLARLEQELLFKAELLKASSDGYINVKKELDIVEDEAEICKVELDSLTKNIETLERKLEKIRNLRLKLETEFKRLEDEKNGLVSDYSLLERDCVEYSSKIESIEMVLSAKVGAGSLVAELVANKNKWGILGRLYELIETDESYVHILEAALGDILSYFVVKARSDASNIINEFRDPDSEIGLIVIDDLPEYAYKDSLNFVSADQVVFSAHDGLKRLFSNILIVSDPVRFAASEFGVFVVSDDGKWVETKGFIRGGRAKSDSGILGLELERKRYINLLNNKKAELAKIEETIRFKENELVRLRVRLNRVVSGEQKFMLRLDELIKERDKLELNLKHKYAKKQDLEIRMKEAFSKVSELERNIGLIRARFDEDSKKRAEIQALLAEQKKVEEQLESESNRLEKEIVQLELGRARSEENIRSFERELERIELEKSRASSRINDEKNKIDKARLELEKIKTEIELKEKELTGYAKIIEDLEFEEIKLEGEISSFKEEIGNSEIAIREKREEIKRVDEETRAAELELASLNERYQAILKEMELEGFFEEARSECLLDEAEEKALEERYIKKKRSLENMGLGVNLDSIDAYEEAKKHLDFLLNQRDDLLNAMKKLKEMIDYLEHESKKKFLSTIELVRESFRTHFLSLFGGGEADLVLKGDDPLEAEIEIVAFPPGKKMLPLAQLSTGENYLTAFALLFGLYSIKPAPFCLLDEVDAPLDELNTMRFINLIKGYSKNVQFIIVTHNRLVVENSDYIYGVTMEEDGVSKVVSLKVADMLV